MYRLILIICAYVRSPRFPMREGRVTRMRIAKCVVNIYARVAWTRGRERDPCVSMSFSVFGDFIWYVGESSSGNLSFCTRTDCV